EVVDDELASTGEEVGQGRAPLRAVEVILLFHLPPGQIAALLAQFVAQAGQLFFLHQQRLASLQPFRIRNNLVTRHDAPLHDLCLSHLRSLSRTLGASLTAGMKPPGPGAPLWATLPSASMM